MDVHVGRVVQKQIPETLETPSPKTHLLQIDQVGARKSRGLQRVQRGAGVDVHVGRAVVPGGAPGAARLVHDRRVGVQRRAQRRLHLQPGTRARQDAGERTECLSGRGHTRLVTLVALGCSAAHSAAFTCSQARALNRMLVRGLDAHSGLGSSFRVKGTAPRTAPPSPARGPAGSTGCW